ncbi:metallophosphoesterase [bacterium]|nr:metallophosphoesterase [bacterium]
MFFLIAFSIYAFAYGYVGWRLISPSGLNAFMQTLAWAGILIFMILPPFTFASSRRRERPAWRPVLVWLTYLSMGGLNFLFFLLLFRDVIWLIFAGVQKAFALVNGSPSLAATILHGNRAAEFLQTTNLVVLGLAGLLLGYGVYQARRKPRVVEVAIPLQHLPEELHGFRIVQLSDLHVGETIKRKFVESVVAQVQQLAPDMIAFTGDLADGLVSNLRDEVAPLANLSARYGKFYITGNHEYYSGAEPWLAEVQRLGFTVLLNEHRIVQHGNCRILIAGVPDFGAGPFIPHHDSNPALAIANAPVADVKILLAHQPRSIFAAAEAGFDLQLSGHTHGGQLFPWNFLVPLQQPYVSGLHKHGNTWIYVSNGTGYWGPPIRLGAPAEVTVIKLMKA